MGARSLLCWCLGLLALVAQAMGVEQAQFVEPDGPVLGIHHYQPAGGAIERYTSLPGAWYALIYLPMEPAWPMELVIWLPQRQQDLHLYALDRAPDQAAATKVLLPLVQGAGNESHSSRVSQFMLPANSRASGIFVLIEQRRADGLPPAPIWLRLRSRQVDRAAYDDARVPWWVTRDPRAGKPDGVRPPASPLTQKMREQAGFVLPIYGETSRPIDQEGRP